MADPTVKSPYGEYLEHLTAGRLAFQITDDGEPVFFPRVLAPGSGSTSLRWQSSKGLGTVYSTTVVRTKNEQPWNVALIDLDEGFRMMSRVEGIAADAVRIGMRVRVRILPGGTESPPLPVFEPLEEELVAGEQE